MPETTDAEDERSPHSSRRPPGRHGCRRVGARRWAARRAGTRAARASAAAPARRRARRGRRCWSANVSVTVPDVPAGTTQPCCQPLTVTGRQRGAVGGMRGPTRVDALGHHQEPRRLRRGHVDLAVIGTPCACLSGSRCGAGQLRGRAGPASCTPSTTNAGAGTDQQFLLPRRAARSGRADTASAAIGLAVEQRADGGVDRGLDELSRDADDRPAAARQRRRDVARLRAASAAAMGLPRASSAVTSARPGGLT